MKIKNLVLINLFFVPFVVGAVLSTTDEIIVNQVVDNSCNENDFCEADLGETISTCPGDCHSGNINPAIIQQGLVEGSLVEVFDVEISTDGGVTTISWKTNEPTASSLIFEDGMGGTEEEYLNELYTTEHSVQIDDFDIDGDFYFRILSKGIYNEDEYVYMDSFKVDFPDKEEVGEDDTEIIKIIKEDSQKLEEGVVVSEDEERVSFGGWIKEYLSKVHIIGEKSLVSVVNEYKYQIGIWGGVLFFLRLLFRKKG